jgi:hypothetical protein
MRKRYRSFPFEVRNSQAQIGMHQMFLRQVSIWRALVALLLLWPSGAARALVVGSGVTPPATTNVNPASYSGWTSGDPGWNTVSVDGRQGVYLGDGWVLTARHVGAPSGTETITFQTSTGPQDYQGVSGQDFVVHNPPPALVNNLDLLDLQNGETDLRLYKINGTPNVSAPQIASRSQPVPSNSQVVTISRGGKVRQESETTWYVDQNGSTWNWSESQPASYDRIYRGFKTTGGNTDRLWGTNRVASPNASVISNIFDNTLSGTTGVARLTTPDRLERNVIVMPTLFDAPSKGGTTWETQGVPGDSGSAVFYNFGTSGSPNWKLVGITNFVATYPDQPTTPNHSYATAIYGEISGGAGGSPISSTGNATFFSDLSYYNQAYSQSICDIMKSCGNYSVVGDVNVDGFISGDGTGPVQSDDISAFVAGWRYDNGVGAGDYVSWTKGDLSLDGKVDATDFFLLRQAYGGSGNGTAFDDAISSAMLGISGVPEPSTAILMLLAVGSLVMPRRRRPPARF